LGILCRWSGSCKTSATDFWEDTLAKLKLALACDEYDYLQPLREGTIQPAGIDLNLLTVGSGVRHERMYRHGEYDACEFSMASYLTARAQGIDRLQAIPFFTRRMFGHKFCFIRKDSEIHGPRDLRGRRVGIRSYENTLAFMVKGMLMQIYQIPLDTVTWVCVNRELVDCKLPDNIRIEHISRERKLEELLLAGEVDAEVEPDLPTRWLRGDKRIERLFPDFEQDERNYYQQTRIFPIMHPIVIKKEIIDRDPWVATSLFEAFKDCRRIYNEFMEQPHRLSFAFARAYLEKERALFGGDPFPQGLRDNRHDLQAMIRFAQEQGLLARHLAVEELFTENTRGT
jgi:4,5-dihydroxyphthalate decarboxylase